MARRPGFAEPAAVVGVVEAVPVDPVRGIGALMVDEHQAEAVADDEGVVGADGVAATALGHGMDVATANPRDFERVPGLDVVPV
jgi:predicted nucleic acid-binding protein